MVNSMPTVIPSPVDTHVIGFFGGDSLAVSHVGTQLLTEPCHKL
jgi:hypothetical protein